MLTGSARLADQQAAGSHLAPISSLPAYLPVVRVRLCLAPTWELGIQTGVLVSRQQALSWLAHSCEKAAAMTSILRWILSPGYISGLVITSRSIP